MCGGFDEESCERGSGALFKLGALQTRPPYPPPLRKNIATNLRASRSRPGRIGVLTASSSLNSAVYAHLPQIPNCDPGHEIFVRSLASLV